MIIRRFKVLPAVVAVVLASMAGGTALAGWGSWGGSYGCWGGSYGCWGGSYGCWGSVGYASGGCYGCYGVGYRRVGPLRRLFHRIHDRHAYVGYACWGGYSYGCYGGYGCYGSYGCHGCYGCWGGSYGCGGCMGYASAGCAGTWTTYDGCHGIVTEPAPAPPEAAPPSQTPPPPEPSAPPEAAPGSGATEPGAETRSTEGASARRSVARDHGLLVVQVPADAKVYVNDRPTTSVGSLRRYISTGLDEGLAYKYVVRAELARDGQTIDQTKVVTLTGGRAAHVRFDFDSAPDVETRLTLHVPDDARVVLSGTETHSTGPVRQYATKRLAAGEMWPDYNVQVSIEQDGRTVSQERTITLTGGQEIQLSFDFNMDRLAELR